MNAPRTVLTLLAFYALIAAALCGADDYASPKDEVSAAVTWFDSLQWPDVRGMPYMEFTLAAKNDDLRWMGRRSTLRGFLINEDDQAYHAFCDGVTRRIFKKIRVQSEAGLPASARELGPTSAVEDEVADLRRPKPEDNPNPFPRPYFRSQWIGTYTHVFVLARCFARQGRTDLTEKLDKALALALATRPVSRISQEADFRVAIEKWIFGDLILESIRDFGDLTVPRSGLQQEFERIAHGFPGADKHGMAQAIAERLRTMIAEDEAHAKTAPPLAAMSPEERVSELIFHLRDENGLQRSGELRADLKQDTSFVRDPLGTASVSIRGSASPSGPDGSPARQLIQLGPAAVPALIAALGSPSLTRSVGSNPNGAEFNPNVDPSTSILTAGECAETILYYISGRHFGSNRGNPRSPQTAGEIEATRARALQWWRDWQAKGEKPMLAEGVSRGDDESLEQARHLVAIDPDAAVQTLAGGIGAAKSKYIRTELIRELATVRTAAATGALRHEMKENPHLGGRIAAAAELWQRGETDAVPAMIDEWAKWQPSIYSPPNDDGSDTLELVDFLSSCGQTAAIEALASRFSALPVETKLLVVQADSHLSFGDPEAKPKPVPAEFEALREDLIVKALDDRTREFGLGTGRDGFNVYAPRVCDMAACALTDRWPDRYAFKWKRTSVDRDLEIAGLRNSWRSLRGLPPLPVTKPPSVDVGAVGANAVAACQWIGGPSLPDAPISVGQPLTADEIIQTILYLHHHVPPDCYGFSLSAERDSGQSGIVVEVEWFQGSRPPSPSNEVCYSQLRLDEHSSAGLFRREGPKDSGDPKEEEQSRDMLSHAIQRGIDQPVSFLCCWRWEKTLLRSPLFAPERPPPTVPAPAVGK